MSIRSPETLLQRFLNLAYEEPGACAMVVNLQTFSRQALRDAVWQVAADLAARGIGRGDVVAVAGPRGFETVVGLLAVWCVGAAFLPMDPKLPLARRQEMAADAKVALLLLASGASQADMALPGIVTASVPDMLGSAVTPQHMPPMADLAAYVFYTSGSTGQPKGAVISQGALAARLEGMQVALPLATTDRFLHRTPLNFDVAIEEIFWPLYAGATIVCAPEGMDMDARGLVGLMASRSITVADFVPTLLDRVVAEPALDQCPALRMVLCGGEAMTVQLMQKTLQRLPQVALYNIYGPTEAVVNALFWRASVDCVKAPPIGRALPGTSVWLLDAEGAPVPEGEVGELCLGGTLASGYLNRDALTRERFITPPAANGERLYRTGDLARMDEAGQVEFHGRTDHQVKLRGARIELGEVEVALSDLPGVQQVCVVVRGEGEHASMVAFIVCDVHRPSAQWRALLSDRLPPWMRPSQFVELASLPCTSVGKVDRSALENMRLERETSELLALCDLPSAAPLRAAFAEVLQLPCVSDDDDFFEMGGNSLAAAELQSALGPLLGVELPLGVLYENPTVRSLSMHLQSASLGVARFDIQRELESHQITARSPNLLSLRCGDDQTLVCVHPGDGGTSTMLPLVRFVRTRPTVLALHAWDLQHCIWPKDSVQAIAAAYVEQVERAVPSGPVHLFGWSSGAVLAHEMACIFQAKGREVRGLALADPFEDRSTARAAVGEPMSAPDAPFDAAGTPRRDRGCAPGPVVPQGRDRESRVTECGGLDRLRTTRFRMFLPVGLVVTLFFGGFAGGALGAVPDNDTPVPLALALSKESDALRLETARGSPRVTQPTRPAVSGTLVAPARPLQLRLEPWLNLGDRRTRAPIEAAADGSLSPTGRVEAIHVLRLTDAEPITLDGRLDEPFWSRAESLQSFHQVDPEPSDSPPVKTEARFASNAETLYVAIAAHDPDPSALVAPLSRRDDLAFKQDRVTIYIDSIGTRRSAHFFEVNPAGVVADGVYDELTDSGETGPDFRFRVQTSRSAEGWNIELAIPITSLPTVPDSAQPWTVLVTRFYPRQESFRFASSPLPGNCTLCVASELRGLERLPHTTGVQGLAHAALRSRRDKEDGRLLGERSRLRLGAEASFKPRGDTVVRMAIRPEAALSGVDEPLLEADLAERRYLVEKRPIFSEAADIIQSPLNLLNTRSVVAPQAALGVTHRGQHWDGAAWLVRDDGARSLLQTAQDNPSDADSETAGDFVLLRGRYLTAAGRWGALLTHSKTRETGAQNTVLGIDGSVRLNDENLVHMQWANSRSTVSAVSGDPSSQDTAKRVSWSHSSDALTTELAWQKVGAEFRAEVGDIEYPDAERFSADIEATGLSPWGDAGPILRLERTRTLSSAQHSESYAAGIYAQLPKDTRIEWLPWITSRAGTKTTDIGRLLRSQQLRISSFPAPWINELSMDLTWGDALYREGPIYGSGLRWSSFIGLQPTEDLQIGWGSELQTIRSGGAYLSKESVNQWVVLWMLNPVSHLKGVLNKSSARASNDSSHPMRETAYTLSYHGQAGGRFKFATGVTLRRNVVTSTGCNGCREQLEWFSSLQMQLQ